MFSVDPKASVDNTLLNVTIKIIEMINVLLYFFH